MITTITLNPAVDKTYTTDALLGGQVNRMRTSDSIPGGKGINVAKILRQFRQPVAAMGFLGGYTGRMIEERMMDLGAECHFTRIGQETRTSMNILADDGYVTELLEPGPRIEENEHENFIQEFDYCLGKSRMVALCGSVPQGIPADIYRQLVNKCREAGKRVIVDTSGEYLKEAVKASPYMIKPNRRELEYLTGRKLRTREDIEEEAKRLLEAGIQKIVVSLGENGLYYFDAQNTLYRPSIEVETLNTVGCGDSVVASYCMSELQGDNPDEALKKALALSAANAVTMESGYISMERYQEFLLF